MCRGTKKRGRESYLFPSRPKKTPDPSYLYVLVNNRSEGNAPLTIQALTDHLLEAQI